MAKDTLFEELTMLVFTALKLDCPVMSGNMKSGIEYDDIQDDFARIVVSAPSYDISYWKKTGIIEHTDSYNYAVSVNNVGAFMGRSKKSKHWANKSVVKACRAVASAYNAEVIVDVGL